MSTMADGPVMVREKKDESDSKGVFIPLQSAETFNTKMSPEKLRDSIEAKQLSKQEDKLDQEINSKL